MSLFYNNPYEIKEEPRAEYDPFDSSVISAIKKAREDLSLSEEQKARAFTKGLGDFSTAVAASQPRFGESRLSSFLRAMGNAGPSAVSGYDSQRKLEEDSNVKMAQYISEKKEKIREAIEKNQRQILKDKALADQKKEERMLRQEIEKIRLQDRKEDKKDQHEFRSLLQQNRATDKAEGEVRKQEKEIQKKEESALKSQEKEFNSTYKNALEKKALIDQAVSILSSPNAGGSLINFATGKFKNKEQIVFEKLAKQLNDKGIYVSPQLSPEENLMEIEKAQEGLTKVEIERNLWQQAKQLSQIPGPKTVKMVVDGKTIISEVNNQDLFQAFKEGATLYE